MTRVAILPVPGGDGGISYTAVAGSKRWSGKTAGEALDALTAQLSGEENDTLIIVQSRQPDAYFNAAQQLRLAELTTKWRTARDQGQALPPDEQSELDALVDAELRVRRTRGRIGGRVRQMNPHYPTVAHRAGHRCEYCRAPEAIFNFAFEVEHVVPTARGGADDETNLALACRACNVRKAAHVDAVDPETQSEVALFHPRADVWETHFRVDVESARIEGITAVGRAVVRLAMNSEAQLAARRQWMRLGLYP
jgi:5-methylcytosine-specific restriction endonuclease McrA